MLIIVVTFTYHIIILQVFFLILFQISIFQILSFFHNKILDNYFPISINKYAIGLKSGFKCFQYNI